MGKQALELLDNPSKRFEAFKESAQLNSHFEQVEDEDEGLIRISSPDEMAHERRYDELQLLFRIVYLLSPSHNAVSLESELKVAC